MNKLNHYLQEQPKAIAWTWCGILILIMVVSIYVDKSHAHSWAERYIPFFWSIFGFAAAAAIIGLARWWAHSGIMVSEDYYERTSGCCRCSSPTRSTEHA